ncbi:hypothetical protein ACFL35_08045 [Candidatus Riflebacteria bacterium]
MREEKNSQCYGDEPKPGLAKKTKGIKKENFAPEPFKNKTESAKDNAYF